jgi:hypothetical protein
MRNHQPKNHPNTQPAIAAAAIATQFSREAWALPYWKTLPYRSVEVTLPDGSCFQLRAPDLAVKAATELHTHASEPMAHLLEQVLPLVQDCPEFLIEVASRLSWAEACEMAREAFWRSPTACLGPHFKNKATMNLHA